MKRVLILNCCYTSNFGDQAIGIAMKKMIEVCDAEPVLFDLLNVSQNRYINYVFSQDVPYLPLVDTPKKQKGFIRYLKEIRRFVAEVRWKLVLTKKIKRACRSEYDYLFIGGGELIQSNGIFPFAINTWIKEFKRKNPIAKIYFFGVGVTRVFSDKDFKLLSYSLKEADRIFVRDRNSQRNMSDIFHKTSTLISDVVLGLGIHTPVELISGGVLLVWYHILFTHTELQFSRVKDKR